MEVDAFVTKLNSTGTDLVYSTYLGSSSADWGLGIAVDVSGDTYVLGQTMSNDFPTKNAYQEIIAGNWDAFIVKISEKTTVPLDSKSIMIILNLGLIMVFIIAKRFIL
jgi:hypothetical protein